MGTEGKRAPRERVDLGSDSREDSFEDEGERETFIREIGPDPGASLLQLETYRELPVHHELPDLELEPFELEATGLGVGDAQLELQPLPLDKTSDAQELSCDAQEMSERVSEYLREAAAEAREHLSQPPPSS